MSGTVRFKLQLLPLLSAIMRLLWHWTYYNMYMDRDRDRGMACEMHSGNSCIRCIGNPFNWAVKCPISSILNSSSSSSWASVVCRNNRLDCVHYCCVVQGPPPPPITFLGWIDIWMAFWRHHSIGNGLHGCAFEKGWSVHGWWWWWQWTTTTEVNGKQQATCDTIHR